MELGGLWRNMREAVARFKGRPRATKRRNDSRRNALFAERLESRELLSVSQVLFDAVNKNVTVIGTAGADFTTVSYDSPSVLRVRAHSVDGLVERTFATSSVLSINFYGGASGDKFQNSTSIASIARGEDGDDELIGGSGVDQLYGGAGADTLKGGDGNDLLYGEAGRDWLLGEQGNDQLFGADENDTLDGGIGNDDLYGGAANDLMIGGDGNDRLWGETGVDRLEGNLGDDQLYGGGGIDTLVGGDGNDLLHGEADNDWLLGDQGNDQLFGGDGNDLLSGGIANDELKGGNGNDEIDGGDGDDRLWGDAGDDRVDGNAGDDELFGGIGNDTLNGGDGNDSLNGDAGFDWLEGGVGHDTLFGGDDNDALSGGEGNDVLDGQAGGDTLTGGLGFDTLYGGIGNDDLTGDDGNDVLYGGDGDDRLRGLAGADRLFGDGGVDLLYGGTEDDVLSGGDGMDLMYGEAGKDWLLGEQGDDQLFGGDDNDTLDGGTGADDLQGGNGNDLLVGGDGEDRLLGEGGADRLEGGADNDQIFGGAGNDILNGDAGNDGLYGEADNDWLIGGIGNDQLFGGEGNDTLSGDSGQDSLNGENGNDFLVGGNDDDTLWGYAGDDRLQGGSGNDLMFGGTGRDSLAGQAGDDNLYGDEGQDDLQGGDGNDGLRGGSDDDWLGGGNGNDLLNGNGGNDQLYGEVGNDELVGSEESDLLFGGDGNDYIRVESGQHTLIGGNGNDALIGSAGSDVLIGGEGVDELRSYGGEDLLIGGSTVYDTNVVQLTSLFAAWSAAAPYATRVAQISNDTFTAFLKSNQTVLDDQIADEIFGGDAQDWFFLTGVVQTYDPNSGSGHDHGGSTDDGGSGHAHPAPVVIDYLPLLEGFDFVDSLDKIGDRLQSETLHTLVAHGDDPTLQREHLTLTQLVRYDQVTHYAVTSGAWSSASTWANGVVPTNGARVLIPVGVKVTVDRVLTTRPATIRVDGTLAFSTTANTELRVDTIVVTNLGRFEMGTAATPIPSNITAKLYFTDNGPIDRQADPFALGRGLISHGSVAIYGAPVLTSSAIVNPLLAGTSLLVLESLPTGWKIGNPIVIAGAVAGTSQNEIRSIVAIVGNTVYLDRPLTYNHIPDVAGGKIHVANGMRNVWILSESEATDRRGHVMFMHNRDVHIANAGFYRLGRTDKSQPINDSIVDANWQLKPGSGTNQRARYPVHFHRNGFIDDGNPATITGSVVTDSLGWGFVNHSSYVDMVNNFAYNSYGAGFATEVGNEIGSFVNNISIGSAGSGEDTESRVYVQDFGHQGDGFWFQGTGVYVTGNVAAGNDGSAFMVFARGLIEGGVQKKFLSANLIDPSIAGGAAEIDINLVPMFDFSNNVGYSSAIGLSIWYHNRDITHGQKGVFRDSTFWGNYYGADIPYTQNTILRNLTIVRKQVPNLWLTDNIGIRSNLVTRGITYENLTVSGHYRGVVMPRAGANVVSGGTYQNYDDFHIQTGIDANRTVLFTGNLQVGRILMDSYFTNPAGFPNYIFLQDRVTLNFGPYRNQRLYYTTQAANAVPFPQAIAGLPSQYVGLSSQQLWNIHRVAVGGTLAPSNVTTVSTLLGLLGPAQ